MISLDATPIRNCPNVSDVQAAYVVYATLPSEYAATRLQDAARRCMWVLPVPDAWWPLMLEGWALLGFPDQRTRGVSADMEHRALESHDPALRAAAQHVLDGDAP